MHSFIHLIKSIFLLLIMLFVCRAEGQDIASMHGKKHLLRGKWQLVSTFSLGSDHSVAKDEYDGTITFLSRHRYIEEVNYESNHWIISGRWRVFRHRAALQLTHRLYTLGQLERAPADITFELVQLDRDQWTGSGTVKGAPVRVTYHHISCKSIKK